MNEDRQVVAHIRDMESRRSALLTYAKAQDHWAELEQLYRATGDDIQAEGAKVMAERALRAYTAEVRGDPPPPGPRNHKDR